MLLNQAFLEVYKNMTNTSSGMIFFAYRDFKMEKEVLEMFKTISVLVFVICFFYSGMISLKKTEKTFYKYD